jgi:hypothetical protein
MASEQVWHDSQRRTTGRLVTFSKGFTHNSYKNVAEARPLPNVIFLLRARRAGAVGNARSAIAAAQLALNKKGRTRLDLNDLGLPREYPGSRRFVAASGAIRRR